jgi:hypothetical protein
MSASQFVQVLENELGWRPAKDRKKLQTADFEWMFISDDANKAFLSWICNHVTKRNVLTGEELQEYVFFARRIFSRHRVCKASDQKLDPLPLYGPISDPIFYHSIWFSC